MGPISCPETSVRIYHHSLRDTPEERSCHISRESALVCQLLNVTTLKISDI